MSEQNIQLVRSMYDAFARADVPSVLERLHPEVEWNEAENSPYADRNPYIGPTAVAEGLFGRLVSEWDYWNVDVQDLLDAGDTVLALGRYRAKNKRTGSEIDAQFAHVWSLKNGKATAFQQYTDTAQVTGAMAG